MTNRPPHFQNQTSAWSLETPTGPAPIRLLCLHRNCRESSKTGFLKANIASTLSARSAKSETFPKKLLWLLQHRGFETCGVPEMRCFFAYLSNGCSEPGGRRGNPRMTEAMIPARVMTYYAYLKSRFLLP